MRLRNLVVWNEDANEQPEERKETKNKRGKRKRDQERIVGDVDQFFSEPRKKTVIPESCHSSVNAKYP